MMGGNTDQGKRKPGSQRNMSLLSALKRYRKSPGAEDDWYMGQGEHGISKVSPCVVEHKACIPSHTGTYAGHHAYVRTYRTAQCTQDTQCDVHNNYIFFIQGE